MELIHLLGSESISDPNYKSYLRTLISYFAGNTAELLKIPENADPLLESEKGRIELLSATRKSIFFRTMTPSSLEKVIKSLPRLGSWQGEALNLIARSHEILGDEVNSKRFYAQAKNWAKKMNFSKKSILMELNETSAETRIESGTKDLLIYFKIAKEAARCGNRLVYGIAILNIAREMSEVGAFNLTIKYSELSLKEIALENTGSLPYFLALACRCYGLIGLGRLIEAKRDLENLGLSQHTDIQFLRENLKLILKQKVLTDCRLSYQWFNNQLIDNSQCANIPLSEQEENLVQILTQENLPSKIIEEQLWGSSIDIQSRNQRFKRLLARLRKKQPHLVSYESGYYRLRLKALS